MTEELPEIRPQFNLYRDSDPFLEMLSMMKTTFVGRSDEIDLWQDCVEIVKAGGTPFQSVLNYHGGPGMGKTTLLRELGRQSEAQNLPYAFVDLNDPKYFPPDTGRVNLLEDIASSISNGQPVQPDDFENVATRSNEAVDKQVNEQIADEMVDKITEEFLNYCTRLLEYLAEPPLVLLLDNVNFTLNNRDTLDWFEKEILIPLQKTNRLVVAMTSDKPTYPKEFALRRGTYAPPLRGFNLEEVKQQVGPSEYLAPQIYDITFGHPGATYRIAEYIPLYIMFEGAVDSQKLELWRPALIRELTNEFVYKSITKEAQDALGLLSPLRGFDLATLKHLLTHFLPEDYQDWRGHQFLSLLRQLPMVEWEREMKAYVIDAPFRQMLTLDLKVNEPEKYRDILQAAIDYYSKRADQIGDSQEEEKKEEKDTYLEEKRYHEEVLGSTQFQPT